MVDDESDRTLIVTPGQRFGRRLREQREHHQITLDAIAASTKIKASLLAGLERGDISEWPAGIFRRGFVREYARAIGLAPEPVVADFARAFAADTSDGENAGAASPPGQLRLTLAIEPLPPPAVHARALAALAEALSIAAAAAIVGWITAAGFGTACGALALLYYPIATAWLGCSPIGWYLRQQPGSLTADPAAERTTPAAAERRDRLYLVKPVVESEPAPPAEERAEAETDSPLSRSAAR